MKEKLRSAFAIVMGCALLGGYALIQVAFRLLLRALPAETIGTGILLVVVGISIRRKRDRAAGRRIDAWVSAGDWTSVSVHLYWPWVSLLRRPGTVLVDRAWTATVAGLPVRVGELNWDDNALDGAVVGWKGRGVFAAVRLPVPTEPMTMRRPHRTIGDSHRLDLPALHDAYENGEIPPWTARDQDLFTFQAIEGRLTPEHLDDLVRRTLLVIRLLDLSPDVPPAPGSGPDVPLPPGSSVAAGGGGAGQVEGGVGGGACRDGRLGESLGG